MSATTSQAVDFTTESQEVHLPVYGLPGYEFFLIHGIAVASLGISMLVSTCVLVYLIKPVKTFFSRPIGDRIVIYMAAIDLFFSTSHMLDHAYMLGAEDHPPDALCALFAFFINQFLLGQALVVMFTAVNAFSMVILTKKINTGKYDWRLIAFAMGIPGSLGILGASTGHFGPSGAWCWFDFRLPLGPILGQAGSIFIIITFLLNIICYSAIWLKLRQVALAQAAGGNKPKYMGTTRIMMLFVAVYIVQWWAYAAFGIWAMFEGPHVAMFVAAVFFGNFGGVFNFLVYTVIRRKYQKVGTKQAETSAKAGATQSESVSGNN